MNQKLLKLNSVVESEDKYNGLSVNDLIEKKGTIFQMIKKGYQFDDEVLSKCNISHTVKEHKIELVISEHEKDRKRYKKDTASLKEIIKEIEVLDYGNYEEPAENDNDTEEIEETTENV